jgi:hypothetical protein
MLTFTATTVGRRETTILEVGRRVAEVEVPEVLAVRVTAMLRVQGMAVPGGLLP